MKKFNFDFSSEFLGALVCANGRAGQTHRFESSGISAMAWLNMSAVANRSQRNPKRKRHSKLKNENVERDPL